MSRGETRATPRGHAAQSLTKCIEFSESAQAALGDRRWNSAGLDAIHAGVAAADAALIATAGLRSISKDHGAAMDLIETGVPEFTATQRRQLAGLLKMNNQVAYEQRLLTEMEARQLVDHATRLAKWATGVVTNRL
ncbi:MAG: hypothetical protein U1E22_06745 [Coriobacteriia bacterium]|nr:hypothetical protein [Coriobacteriia bacterium]